MTTDACFVAQSQATQDRNLVVALRAMAPSGRDRTHYVGCWRWHIGCVMQHAAARLEQLVPPTDSQPSRLPNDAPASGPGDVRTS